ncbi:ADP-ribosylglycohydrolase family protein [Clavibacter michiganensis subsp. phaseoli]|uniref:ADP-ribosylglycohydrolase family protein n=1 Tax=Clavibacter phaseoli TaxID=1734031 RepID=A0A8I0VAP2_9MICO|nr:ADP-ribosylglycohydrolase family protein [Clavibacter phaseoli]MBF4632718.1 ADP-ribosylglycohydrolase family protein [Clavibacter phaseoli]
MEYISDIERQFAISQEPHGLVTNELTQAEETGNDVGELRSRFDGLGFTGADDDLLRDIYKQIPLAPPAGWSYYEQSDLESIHRELTAARVSPAPSGDVLFDKVRGGWYGRVAGNMLGKPVEIGFPRLQLKGYLESMSAYPLKDYVPIDLDTLQERGFVAQMPYERLARGQIRGGVRDDDVDYTVLGLHLLETYGRYLTTRDIAGEWLQRFPLLQLYTAERATYNNLIREVPLDRVGEFQNPFREWIGALIRADIFGYVFPGDPRQAADFAHRDAILSHRANGVYGEMWAAALISSAFTAESPEASIEESLNHIPSTSRLAEAISLVVRDHGEGKTWDEAAQALEKRYDGMSWVHTINNAAALTAAILWGEGDFTRTVALSVQAGLDSDSIGASAGSWAGIFVGFDRIPQQWISPLGGRTVSAVFGYSDISLDEQTQRTISVIRKLSQVDAPQ